MKTKRVINYYQLSIQFHDLQSNFEQNPVEELFIRISENYNSKKPDRYLGLYKRIVSMGSIVFHNSKSRLMGKLLCTRKDILPELLNMQTDETKGIEASDEEGLLEVSHFIIDYSDINNIILCLEYNQFGSKVGDLIKFLLRFGEKYKVLSSVNYIPIVKGNIKKLINRIQKLSKLQIRIHNENIPKLKQIDAGIYEAAARISEFDKTEYIEMTFKYNYKEAGEKKSFFTKITDFLSRPKSDIDIIDSLVVNGQDSENNLRIEEFDLLSHRVRSKIDVEKKEKYRTIVSKDIFEKMEQKLEQTRLI